MIERLSICPFSFRKTIMIRPFDLSFILTVPSSPLMRTSSSGRMDGRMLPYIAVKS